MDDKKFVIKSIKSMQVFDKATGELIMTFDNPILVGDIQHFDINEQRGSNPCLFIKE